MTSNTILSKDYPRPAALFSALERGDERSLRDGLATLLDAGDRTSIVHTVQSVHLSSVDSRILFEDAIEQECQIVTSGSYSTALFSIPVMFRNGAEVFDVSAISKVLDRNLGSSEQIVVCRNWVEQHALTGLHYIDYRRLCRWLSTSIDVGVKVSDLPCPLRPAGIGSHIGSLAFYNRETGQSDSAAIFSRLHSRFILGAVRYRPQDEKSIGLADHLGMAHPDPGGSTHGDALGLKILHELQEAVGQEMTIIMPSPPITSVLEAKATFDLIALDARMSSVTRQIGQKPITACYLHENLATIVMSADGVMALDGVTVRIDHADHQLLSDTVYGGSRGVIICASSAELPHMPPCILH